MHCIVWFSDFFRFKKSYEKKTIVNQNQIQVEAPHLKRVFCGWHIFPRQESTCIKETRKCWKMQIRWQNERYFMKTCNLSHIWIIDRNNFSRFACKIKCFLQINKLHTECRSFVVVVFYSLLFFCHHLQSILFSSLSGKLNWIELNWMI